MHAAVAVGLAQIARNRIDDDQHHVADFFNFRRQRLQIAMEIEGGDAATLVFRSCNDVQLFRVAAGTGSSPLIVRPTVFNDAAASRLGRRLV